MYLYTGRVVYLSIERSSFLITCKEFFFYSRLNPISLFSFPVDDICGEVLCVTEIINVYEAMSIKPFCVVACLSLFLFFFFLFSLM